MPAAPLPPKPEDDLLGLFVRPIHDAGFRYIVAGSVAGIYFSEPRLTIDVDIPIFLRQRDLPILSALFAEPDFYCPPPEILSVEADRECRGHFNIIHIPTGLKADLYPAKFDETFTWAWQNKVLVESDSGPVYLAPPEYVILWKLIFYREGKIDNLPPPYIESITGSRMSAAPHTPAPNADLRLFVPPGFGIPAKPCQQR